MKNLKTILFILTVLIFISTGCEKRFELNKDLTKHRYEFINQDSSKVILSDLLKGHTTVMGFIYTHCPDICPITTHNMYLTNKQLKEEGIEGVKFIAVSFDPDRDTPSVLKKYAEIRNYDMDDWTLLTGNKEEVYSFLDEVKVNAITDDTTYSDNGDISYYFLHTDRISLVDSEGKLRKNYGGSTLDINTLVDDIKYLGD